MGRVTLDGWWCLFACFLEEDLEEGFEGKKGEIVRFGNSMKTFEKLFLSGW